MKMTIVLEGDEKEFANLIRELAGEDTDLRGLIAGIEKSDLRLQTGAGGNTTRRKKDIDMFIFESISWSSMYLYDVILNHHTSEGPDLLYMTARELTGYRLNDKGQKFDKEQLSRIVGGTRQTTNRLKVPPLFEIRKVGSVKKFGASKQMVPAFKKFKETIQMSYESEMKERNYSIPGKKSGVASPEK